ALVTILIPAGKEVMAQDGGTYAEKQVEQSPAYKDFQSRLTQSGAVYGPFNITVFPHSKGESGFRYLDVPYFQFIGNSIIMFPSGKKDRFGNEWYIYSSTFTLECHPRINPRERRR
ncbi:MAG: hypothetical protein ACXABY_15890, partial [Candidatus Thorarchaeota archaeon]